MKRKESNSNSLLKTEGHKVSRKQNSASPTPSQCPGFSGTIYFLSDLSSLHSFEQVKHSRNACTARDRFSPEDNRESSKCWFQLGAPGYPGVSGPAEEGNSHFPLDVRTSALPALHTLKAALCWGTQHYQHSDLAEKLRKMKNPTPFCSSTLMPAQIRDLRNCSSSKWELSDSIKHWHCYCTNKCQINFLHRFSLPVKVK